MQTVVSLPPHILWSIMEFYTVNHSQNAEWMKMK